MIKHSEEEPFSRPGYPGLATSLPFVLPALALTIVLCGVSCAKKAAVQAPAPMVQIVEVTATNAPMSTEIIGQLDSPQNVEVRARVEAFVEKVMFNEGTMVKEGDVLFLLDKKPSQERLAAANGMLAEATAALNKYDKDVAR